MKRRFQSENAGSMLRDRIIGMGERSIRKSYYPQLLQQVENLEKAQKKLADSEARYRSLVENINDVIFSLDAERRVTYISPVIRNLSGLMTDRSIGRPFEQFVHAEDQRALAASFEHSLAGKPAHQEFRLLDKEGAFRSVSMSSRPLAEEGRVVGLTGVISDITERKRIENILQARLRLLEFANTHSTDELLAATVDEIEALTESTIGFYHFLESAQETPAGGAWVECVEECRPVIHNDCAALGHNRMSEEHVPLVREAVVPVLRGTWIKAIIGVGNKLANYTENDIEIVSQLGDLSWDIAERKRADEALLKLNEELEQRVKDRTAELEGKNRELQRLNKLFVGRELRMVELKKRIAELEARLNTRKAA